MSGLDLLLSAAIDYERTHQVVLYMLFEKSDLPELLVGVRRTKPTEWEPEGQLFDLGLWSDDSRILLEIKMWSSLTDKQLPDQVKFLKEHGHRGVYVLLGTSWFEFDKEILAERTDGVGERLGYEEIINALERLLNAPGQLPDVCDLAGAYKDALCSQFTKLKDACYSESKGKPFYYSLFWRLKQELKEFKTAIYSANNPGGPVYILNNRDWESLHLNGVATELYCEVVNNGLCIKFHAESEDAPTRKRIRDAVRVAAHAVLDDQLKVTDPPLRYGAYMTACQVEHDFSVVKDMAKSVEVFATVGRSLALIADKLRPAGGG